MFINREIFDCEYSLNSLTLTLTLLRVLLRSKEHICIPSTVTPLHFILYLSSLYPIPLERCFSFASLQIAYCTSECFSLVASWLNEQYKNLASFLCKQFKSRLGSVILTNMLLRRSKVWKKVPLLSRLWPDPRRASTQVRATPHGKSDTSAPLSPLSGSSRRGESGRVCWPCALLCLSGVLDFWMSEREIDQCWKAASHIFIVSAESLRHCKTQVGDYVLNYWREKWNCSKGDNIFFSLLICLSFREVQGYKLIWMPKCEICNKHGIFDVLPTSE